jgi:ATP-dependent helicase/nuclease subunit A
MPSSLRRNQQVRELRDYGLGRSFRTSQPVLDFVDKAIESIGHEAFGLDRPAEAHVGWKDRRGYVSLWRPVGTAPVEDEDEPEDSDGARARRAGFPSPTA